MAEKTNSLVFLKRGGVLIPTSAGHIQYGIPPETIKDTMKREGGVPDTFIVPRHMFDLNTGVALAEMEFPIYFNFFVRKGKTRIICSQAQKNRIETVISEALFGPVSVDIVQEFAEGENTPGFPDLRAEMDHFLLKPAGSERGLALDDLIEFVVLDAQGKAAFDGIEVRFDDRRDLKVSEKGREIACIDRDLPVIPPAPRPAGAGLLFRPPLFGITTLGAGHGFDPDADTSGLIVWVNRRGIMVDPPVHSTAKLLGLGVSPKWIDSIILTHCHADHDAGTLQKILQEGKTNLYTTDTIFRSFMKKCEALTGIEACRLKSLIRFYPVCIGKPMIIGGGRFNFNYTLHSIPTISVQVSQHKKSVMYSSDTLNDPQYIEQLYLKGVLTKNRRDFLLDFPWEQDVVFHEAGVPPLHTPMSRLCSLPERIRKRIYLVHVNPETVPAESGLQIAPTGLTNTIELDVHPLPHDEAIQMLDTLSQVELFETLGFEKARELLLVAEIENYKASAVIFDKEDAGDRFYAVMSGEVDIVVDGKTITTYAVGGYFGEKSLFLDERRTATAVARTDARLLTIRKEEMLSLIRGTESEWLLRRIADFQNVELRETLKDNPILGSLTATQQTRLHGLIRPFDRSLHPRETVTEAGYAFVVRQGEVEVREGTVVIGRIARGGLFGVRAMFDEGGGPGLSFVATGETSLYCIDHADLGRYLDANPGVYVKMYHSPY
jgi:CRP-like cAMP-binding protein/ribonuclease BN (tRNA processing enzyme)